MIRLREEHLAEIRRHGEETYPHECCGFLLGSDRNGTKVVETTRRATNTRDDSPRNRYLVEPDAYHQAEAEAARLGLDLVGIYHSHPDHPAYPSQFDRDHASPWFSYLIVAVHQGKAVDLTSWEVVDPDAFFESEPFEVVA
ncbi:MAG: M67 family metallopeptidase [Candidatus Eisenbacteria bacterium]|nr:M67 family metallopeptidase [Candidatus Eisenbacteria bacterium]MCC7143747.1 M67 family metallopeptidase [Candidatus Eisenbacteria bacterium]